MCVSLGAIAVQRLIDAGALITWQEENGLEMVAEFTREVGGSTQQNQSFGTARVRFSYSSIFIFIYES